MRRFRGRLAALPVMLAVIVGSCGEGSSSSSGSGGGVAVAPTPTPSPSPSPTPTPTTSGTQGTAGSILTQADARVGACINMANHLEADPTEGSWGRAISDTDFTDIAAVGFETVRLPVRWSNHAMSTPPYSVDADWMARVVEVVGQARAAGLRVILNDHHYDAIFDNPDSEKERFAAIWKQVAEQFKDADDMVWFELMNEPHNQITDANLLSILEPALAEVRASNPTRPVVIGGQNYSGINSLATLPLPDDQYLIATFHFYDPFNFTHQGAPWVSPIPPVGRAFGSAADLQELDNAVQKARDFLATSGRPVFIGEFGAYDEIPLSERAEYYEAVSSRFSAAEIDSCAWGYTNTFGFRQSNGVWHAELLRAVGL